MTRHQLPLPDYDELPLGALRHRMRALSAAEVRQLQEHERAHAHRIHVLELLSSRLDELEHGATPSPGSQESVPEATGHARHSSPVHPGGSPEPIHPPPHGMTGQQGRAKGNRPRRQG